MLIRIPMDEAVHLLNKLAVKDAPVLLTYLLRNPEVMEAFKKQIESGERSE